ncbi:MAG: DUF1569 domain-containing protein [Saprospiraceae bacterium]
MKNVFNQKDIQSIIDRINKLSPETQPQWGKMSVDQMLAHCNVTYDMAYTDKYPKPGFLKKLMLKMFVKGVVVSDKPYTKNGRTAPEFIITDARIFEAEKKQLIANINKTQELGAEHFEGKDSHSFGKLSSKEWNNLFGKHLEHHLTQFGV